MSVIGKIKADVKKSGTSKSKIVYFKADSKVRIRFLDDVDDGLAITFHDNFALGINTPCQATFKRKCQYCDDDDVRTRELYAWSVYDYDANEVKILLAPANSFSPVPALIGMYEEYGTLTDRDYVINRTGSQTNTSYSVVPMDKATFKNKKAKSLGYKGILEIIDKAFPSDVEETKNGKKQKAKPTIDEDEEEVDEELDYEEMETKELYKLCVEREIDAKPKMKKNYYIELLEAADNAEEDDEEDEEDEW